MKQIVRSLSITSFVLENIRSSSSNISEVSSNWPMMIVSSFIRSVNEVYEDTHTHEAPLHDEVYQQCMNDLPQIIQQLVLIAMKNCKKFALLHWPVIVLQWIGRNDLVGKNIPLYL